jgi:hypothetical protein
MKGRDAKERVMKNWIDVGTEKPRWAFACGSKV